MLGTQEMTRDELIQRNVLDELHWNTEIKPTEVGVQVQDGIVTLTGTVHTYSKRRAAAEAVLRIEGVRGVVNDLEVQLFPHGPDDAEIARRVAQAIEWHTSIPEDRVKVQVADGWVTLEGNVDRFHQKHGAEQVVEVLEGVRGVTNRLLITPNDHPGISPEELKTQIERAFMRNAEIDAHRIKVTVHGSTVTLEGNVRSWSERRQAVRTAWSVPGVVHVEDELDILDIVPDAQPEPIS